MKRKILVVEDEAINAMLISSQLNRAGYDVCSLASTGEDALRIAQAENPDFLLIDVSLAGTLDGIETARKILEIRDVPFAFITGYSSDTISRRVTSLKPAAYLTKPIQFRQIENILIKTFEK